jgi:CBS domain containing-hemolysin-like protein
LTTILWGNVGINVLLTLLSNSVLAGISAFFFSTVIITVVGEIMPQAYFSAHALRMASLLAPVLKFYQILLFPAAKPAAKILDAWLGARGIQYFREHSLRNRHS